MSKEIKKDWKKIKEKSELQEEQEINDLDEDEEEVLDPSQGLEHPSYAALEEKLTEAEQQAHENWEKSVYAMAELENVRRRAERDVENAHRYGLEKFISSLLPVLDSLDQALQLADTDDNASMREGLELTLKLFMDVLEKYDVQMIDPQGEAFNPQEHEAMTMQESSDAAPNTVLAVFQKGYKLHDRVLRAARVSVAKSKS